MTTRELLSKLAQRNVPDTEIAAAVGVGERTIVRWREGATAPQSPKAVNAALERLVRRCERNLAGQK